MRRWFFLSGIILALVLFAACGSETGAMKSGEMEGQMHGEEPMGSMGTGDAMKSSDVWIREEPVDVAAIDADEDGFVYQDQMDWNVIADEEGKCPKCGMILKKVTIDEAVANLKENGFTVK